MTLCNLKAPNYETAFRMNNVILSIIMTTITTKIIMLHDPAFLVSIVCLDVSRMPNRWTDANAVKAEPPKTPDAFHTPSDSPGVEVVLKGWRTGLNKVQLTKTFRAGGIGLNEASKLTGQILEGREVHVKLLQFPTLNHAKAALTKIGVADIHE